MLQLTLAVCFASKFHSDLFTKEKKMKTLFTSIVLLIVSVNIAVAEDAPGYTDTPFLPNSEWRIHDQKRPQPEKVLPGVGDLGATPPSDAVILFDGKLLEKWTGKNTGDNVIENGAFDIIKTGGLSTKENFGSCQLHIEWATVANKQDRMTWGNSGVFFLDGAVEIQIIESCDSYIYADGNAGAVYGQSPPLVNPARKPGEWQSFDILFNPPKIEDGKQTEPATVTVYYNGVCVQNNVKILGNTLHKTLPKPLTKTAGKISLQDHHSPVLFRNIWLRKL
jgi:hypothetical protein